MRPCKLVAISSSESSEVGGPQFKVRSFEFVVLMSLSHDVGDGFLFMIAFEVCRGLVQIRFDDMHFAEMSSAVAFLAHALVLIVMAEVGLGEFAGSLVEHIFIGEAFKVVMS